MNRLTFAPALPCAECGQPTTRGYIVALEAQDWQLLPLCQDHHRPSLLTIPPAAPPDAVALRQHIDVQITHLDRLQRRQLHGTCSRYLQARHQRAPIAVQRALRRSMGALYRQAESRGGAA